MKALQPELDFDAGKPFYGLILGYLAQVHGFIELASRGLSKQLQAMSPDDVREWLANAADDKQRSAIERGARSGITELLGDLELASLTGSSLKVDISTLATEVFWDHHKPLRFFNRTSAGGLLITAWEITQAYHTTDPLWEFFRHCRNAAAHRGHFHFPGDEPRRPAKWRTLEILPGLHGNPLFPETQSTGFLQVGDVLHLLADVEGANPSIT